MTHKDEIIKIQKEIEQLEQDGKFVKNDITTHVINSNIELKKARLTLLHYWSEIEEDTYLIVEYRGEMDYYDALTTAKHYGVFDENESQYFVLNDLGRTSKISKEKFVIING